MINMMAHYATMLLMAGIGLGSSPVAAPSPASAPTVPCVTSVNVSSAIINGAIIVTAVDSNETSCTMMAGSGPCNVNVSATASVLVTFAASSQFAYYDARNSRLVLQSEPTSIPAGGSFDFGVVAASGNKVLALPDPTITVTIGSCGGDADRR